jgi:GTPase-associated protein 1, N-terminal domain type 2/GTPase-associated protein 1, middle domain
MSQELHYTSVPRGLKPGSRGFCTVGQTPHMSVALADRLEALSGYQPVFPPHDPSAPLNPIVFSHLRLTIAGKTMSVLSRIGPAGLDYTGRPNKYAHHVVLEGSERPEGGPAWLLSQPGFMQSAWEGEPREVPAGRIPPHGDHQPGAARAWQSLTGDGGWAGVLAEAFLADPRRTAFLVFRPGMDVLSLFVEALALLPAARRWDVDFSTYFTPLPQGVTCTWRSVLEGSAEAKNARRLPNALVLDLCQEIGPAKGGELVYLGRTGERVEHELGAAAVLPESGRHVPRLPRGVEESALSSPNRVDTRRDQRGGGSYELVPELARLVADPGSQYAAAKAKRRAGKRPWVIASALVAFVLITLVLSAIYLGAGKAMKLLGSNPEIAVVRESVAEEKKIADIKAAESEPATPVAPPSPREQVRASVAPVPTNTTTTPSLPERIPKPRPELAAPERIRPHEEPGVLYFPLPSAHASGLGGSETEGTTRPLKGTRDRIDRKTYFMGDVDIRVPGDDGSMEIWTKSVSAYGVVRLASFSTKDGELCFRWSPEAAHSKHLAESLRDGVLKATTDNGHSYYVLLRGSEIIGKPFPLGPTGEMRLMSDDLKPRNKELEWTNSDSLVGTKWPLGIRKWRLTSQRLPGPPKVIASGDEKSPLQQVEAEIIPKEAWMRFEIASKDREPHLIKVRVTFASEVVHKRRRDTLRLLQLETQRHRTGIEQEEMIDLTKDRTRRQENAEIERFLTPPSFAQLSVIIGLKIDESTVLEIARFGEFPRSPR